MSSCGNTNGPRHCQVCLGGHNGPRAELGSRAASFSSFLLPALLHLSRELSQSHGGLGRGNICSYCSPWPVSSLPCPMVSSPQSLGLARQLFSFLPMFSLPSATVDVTPRFLQTPIPSSRHYTRNRLVLVSKAEWSMSLESLPRHHDP